MSYTDEAYTAQCLSANNSSQGVKQRQSRLRASCDGCFLAKVKCSKAKPICSRCLACGAECRYSPSSRIGKPKPDVSKLGQPGVNQTGPVHRTMSESDVGKLAMDSEWSRTPGSSASPSGMTSSIPAMMDSSSEGEGSIGMLPSNIDMLGNLSYHHRPPPPRPYSIDDHEYLSKSGVVAPTTWFETQAEYLNPTLHAVPEPMGTNIYADASLENLQNCNCFAICLEALQLLHSHSGPPSSPFIAPFDVVLNINRRAVEGCSEMLSCVKCISKGGINTSTMLLGTIIGKIISFYRAASRAYFGFSGSPTQVQTTMPLPLTFGTYKVAGEDGRWLQMEILLRELRKLEELFARFRDVCGKFGIEGDDDFDMKTALLDWLGRSLRYTFAGLNMQNEVTFC